MKRMFCLICLPVMLLLLWGCTPADDTMHTFYYLRTDETIRYGEESGFIAPVTRNIAGQDADLDYLLQLYLDGPAEEGFRSPFPRNTYLLSSFREEDALILVLSREFSTLDHMQLTLSGACLASTCRDLTGAERIIVRSGENQYEFDSRNYIFLDGSTGQ